MNAKDFEKMAKDVTRNFSGKTISHAGYSECGMGYSLILYFTDGTSTEIIPEYDEGFKFSDPRPSQGEKGERPMDIKEVEKRRGLLEENILKNLNDFEAETGLVIERIDLEHTQAIGKKPRIRIVQIKIVL